MRRALGGLGAVIGGAGFVVAITAATVAMHDVMVETGGACASGGPYEIAQPCPAGATAMLVGGILGAVLCAFLLAGSLAALGGPVLAPSLALWGIGFGALGWSFVDLGLVDPPRDGTDWGWALSGGVFWAMALGGLVPASIMAFHRLRRGSAPPEPLFTQGSLVRAAVLPPDQHGR